MKNYGDKIAHLRKLANLTQAELGEELNVTAQAVSKWENGLSEPDLETIDKICVLFNISHDKFFSLNGEADSSNQTEEAKFPETENTAIIKPSDKRIEGYCERCSKPLYTGEYVVKSQTKSVRHGNHHTHVTSQHTYCKDCNAKIEREEREARIRQSQIAARERKEKKAKELRRGFIWGSVAGIVALLIGLSQLNTPDVTNGKVITLSILAFYAMFAMVCQLFWLNSVTEVFLFFCKSFKMPGVIFSFDLEGLISLITIKLTLAILSIALSVLLFIVGLFVTGAYAAIIFPFALVNKIKE